MITSLDVEIPITYNGCPRGISFATCPLRKYVAENKTVFTRVEDTLYLPESSKNSWDGIISDIKQMREICAQCQMANKQKTK